MPQFFLNKRLIILLVSIIILVALIGFSLREREKLSWPEQFVKDTTGWVQSLVSKPAHSIAGFFENIQDLQNTYHENEELKTRIEDLVKLESKVQQLEQDNDKLREVLDKKDSLSDFKPLQATVIGRSPDRWHEMVIIDKGKTSEIEKNMAVITSKGLIGKVKNVNTFTSTVQLLSGADSKVTISAIVQGEQDAYGFVDGYDQDKKMLLIKRIPYDAKIEKGQKVITSGLGGVFPAGLQVGEVTSVIPDQFGLNQTAFVKPWADFYDIEHVMVVKRKMINPDFSEIVDEKEEEQ